ncbi:hypothetical protein CARUB_v10015822mg, partial [Capsella rubella]
MEDVGRPPGEETVVRPLWVDKVQGSGAGGVPCPEKVLSDEFVTARMRLEFPDGKHGEPVITVGQEVVSVMRSLWKNCMLVKVLDRHVPIAALSKRLRELWKPTGGMSVLDLPRQFFMVRFDNEADYMAVMTGGPWRLFGSVLMVQAWSPSFDPQHDEIRTTPVWVRVSKLPVLFYHKAILMGIAEGLGKPLRVDLTTFRFERARFARICVEVDLTQPLKGSVMVNGDRYFVSYEGLSNICSSCGLYGHLVNTCPSRMAERLAQVSVQEMSPVVPSGGGGSDGFTEVRRTSRRSGTQMAKESVAVGAVTERQERNVSKIASITENEKLAVSNKI